jgi:hypothetical protein
MIIEPELLFVFLKGMTGALAPFDYLVCKIRSLSRVGVCVICVCAPPRH